MKIKIIILIVSLSAYSGVSKSQIEVPEVYKGIQVSENNELFIKIGERKIFENKTKSLYKISDFVNAWKNDKNGLQFNSENGFINGTMYVGLIHFSDSKYPHPVYFKRSRTITKGKTFIPIKDFFKGHYDMVGWEKSGRGAFGYRILDTEGRIIYNGTVGFVLDNEEFKVDTTIIEGPFINLINENSVTISYKTNYDVFSEITINKKTFKSDNKEFNHELQIADLKPDTKYEYVLKYGSNTQKYSFKTAHKSGIRKPFVFAYASDSRGGNGGGERDIYGHNGYIVKKIMAYAAKEKVAFMQYTGDLIDGYSVDREDIDLQYANFKNTISPFARYFPVYATMGNHEALICEFIDSIGKKRFSVDKFPFETESAEKAFADNFVNPVNGPKSEDGAYYDIDANKTNFPPYEENVFSYSYDNVGVIVLNSNYFYSPITQYVPVVSGNIHGYIMDNQMKWLENTLEKFEKDKNIDHVFVTVHTPFFPNGGHVRDDMYYGGDNSFRPYIAGKAVDKGIIERRDQMLELIVNKNKKVAAILTGDEHNYCKLKLTPELNIYPEKYSLQKIKLSRTIYQINNGAAGAPYYAKENPPWTENVSGFTTQNAIVLFYVDDKKISMKVFNPDTLELVDELELR
ncbi:MAG: metallophosphoesterase family protein [Bacteroidales bacterium]|nr:metallophosphoesterase family protein [Bacteroidales bacterium]MBN2758701.1 metallophosphoesterase family protein [Bacteroidales bacterium]